MKYIKLPLNFHFITTNLTNPESASGQVIEVYTGRDGAVHSAKVKLSETTLIRPVNKFCILENEK